MTLAVSIAQGGSNNVTQRNRIINGAMVIDQRNAGASVSVSGTVYSVDRFPIGAAQSGKFTVQQNAGSVTPPAGFTNYLGATVGASANVTVGSTDYFYLKQAIEGYNTADLNWGSSNAKTVTLSFWVRSSVTGSFGGSIYNSAADRCYPFSYTISSASTWEQKSITIAGDQSGTWVGATNGIGIQCLFALGYGSSYLGTANTWQSGFYGQPTGSVNWITTNSATFYITGVQLEAGTTASPFEYRQYGTELALCQRYYYRFNMTTYGINGFCENSAGFMSGWSWTIPLRTTPTLVTTGTASDYGIRTAGAATVCSAVPTLDSISINGGRLQGTISGGFTAGAGAIIYSPNNKYLDLNAEL
jgi:hypothetical protein